LRGDGETLDFDVHLPENETQLVLEPGESVGGPVMMVACLREGNDRENRAAWMRQRAALARKLYGGPVPAYPLVYNHWYETRFAVDGDFLRRQVAAMKPYGLDAFVVDAGWYEGVGDWTPARDKFAGGEFEGILQSVRDAGVKPGIWSCPQFVRASADALPPEVDRPGMYRDFIDGYLLDLWGSNFPKRLVEHVRMLRERYHADWWKYDQDLFTAETRHGAMKNVLAFQEALLRVRAAEPDLIIENCQSGGRMITELTVLATQTQWIRDGSHSGRPHIRQNISTGLQSMEFVLPWAVGRWTNRPNDMDTGVEMTRYLCRSAMMGNWGIVADFDKIEAAQRAVILEAVQQYRRLNALKASYRYDLALPLGRVPVAGVTFYDAAGTAAGSLLYRWRGRGDRVHRLVLDGLDREKTYRVMDVDMESTLEQPGTVLTGAGIEIPFPTPRLSALLFVEAVHE